MDDLLSSRRWSGGLLRTLLPNRGALANARDALQRERERAHQRWEAALAAEFAARRTAGRTSPLGGPGTPDQLARMASGVQLTPEEAARVRDVAPVEGFAAAAGIGLEVLQHRYGLDLWMVTRAADGEQSVLVARGVAGMPVPAGAVQPWAASYCRLMVSGEAPRVAPRAREVPAYTDCAATERWRIGAYIGVPLLAPDGSLFGTLCALSAQEQPDSLADALPDVEQVARLLGTVLAKEFAALERSHAAAEAYALLDRDISTGLLNRRAWQSRLLSEEERCLRSGGTASVLVLKVGPHTSAMSSSPPPEWDEPLRAAADVIAQVCRPADVVARTGPDTVSVLAVDCDASSARALAARLRDALSDAGWVVAISSSSRSRRRELLEAWCDAQA